MEIIQHQTPLPTDAALKSDLKNYFKDFLSNHPRKEIFFCDDPTAGLRRELSQKHKDKTDFVHMGMGGSSLGPETFIKGLIPFHPTKRFHFLNNVDSDELAALLEGINLKNSLFYVVSKSGGTIETLSLMVIIDAKLQEIHGADYDRSEHFVFCTDPKSSYLLDLSKEWKVPCLQVPSDVGGRYSVLTDVGFFPLDFAGIDSNVVYETQQSYSKELESSEELYDLALEVFEQFKKGKNQTVLMPYSSLLKSLSLWFVQLWAESLGKTTNQGPTGLTPLFAYGPTDQHSQMQLFMEGPHDKLLFFIEVEKTKNQFTFNSNLDQKKIQLIKGQTLHDVLLAELNGTRDAFKEKKLTHYTLKIDQVSPENITKLFLFLEALTILVGKLIKVDPFDQPGVELGKILCLKHLEK